MQILRKGVNATGGMCALIPLICVFLRDPVYFLQRHLLSASLFTDSAGASSVHARIVLAIKLIAML